MQGTSAKPLACLPDLSERRSRRGIHSMSSILASRRPHVQQPSHTASIDLMGSLFLLALVVVTVGAVGWITYEIVTVFGSIPFQTVLHCVSIVS